MTRQGQTTAFFTRQLLHWNDTVNDRQMPWKNEKNPYRIWLSEVILQQTRVEQGWHYYLRFIERYPTVADLAAAPDDAVFKLWEGLGYYSRCRNLLAAARQVMQEFGGRFPISYDDIRRLKGVGPYTAAAIASFAYGLPHAVVDGNVIRILARFFGIFTPFDTTAGKKEFAELAQRLLPTAQPAAFNQAMMDFGATVCTPKNPVCSQCPLQANCHAYAHHAVAQLPVKDKKLVRKERHLHYFIIESKRQVLVRRRHEKDIWQGLYEFVLHETSSAKPLGKAAAMAAAQATTGLKPEWLQQLEPVRQQLTHQSLTIYCYRLKASDGRKAPKDYQWVSATELAELGFPRTLARIIGQELQALES